MRTIIGYQRALRTLLGLYLSKPARRLLHIQRRTSVLDMIEKEQDAAEDSSECFYSDSQNYAKIISQVEHMQSSATPTADDKDQVESILLQGLTHIEPER